MRVLLAFVLTVCGVAQTDRCLNTCLFKDNGICNTNSSMTDFTCTCGTDCNDCGTESCDGDFTADCGDGFRTCEKGDRTWCCDRSSKFDHCGDDYLECKDNVSKKTKKTVSAVAIALSVIIPIIVIAAVVVCCFQCVGCPGYKAMHPEPAPPKPPLAKTTEQEPNEEGKEEAFVGDATATAAA